MTDSSGTAVNRTMRMETPPDVEHRVLHEMQIQPGSICRRHNENRAGEMNVSPWFLVVSEPNMSDSGIGEVIQIVWLEGADRGQQDRFFLGDLGVQPPYRSTCEKHDLEIPSEYVDEVSESLLERMFT